MFTSVLQIFLVLFFFYIKFNAVCEVRFDKIIQLVYVKIILFLSTYLTEENTKKFLAVCGDWFDYWRALSEIKFDPEI